MVRYCKYCGKLLPKSKGGKGTSLLYCNPSHRNAYYNSLRIQRINDISPEDFIKKELQKEPVFITGEKNKEYCNEIKYTKVVQSNTGLFIHQNHLLKNVLQVKSGDVIEIKIKVVYRIETPQEKLMDDVIISSVISTNHIQLTFKNPIMKKLGLKYGDAVELNIKAVYRS